jgi:hypothetical protein
MTVLLTARFGSQCFDQKHNLLAREVNQTMPNSVERHIPERSRLNMERIRDALFETKVILAELERDNSVAVSERRILETEISHLEAQLEDNSMAQAFSLRDRARAFYAPPTQSPRASTTS